MKKAAIGFAVGLAVGVASTIIGLRGFASDPLLPEPLHRRLERGRQRFLAALPPAELKELQKFEQTTVATFMRDREERILKFYKARHGTKG